MLEKVLAVTGKPGLYVLVSRGAGSLIVESLDGTKKRMPIFGSSKVVSLSEIAMYTDAEEVPLRQVFKNIFDKYEGKTVTVDGSKEALAAFMSEALPNYDRDRVYTSDMKKLVAWYNILVEHGITDFEEPQADEEKQ
ncbi:MAG: DUF5606 domain-containing protein [Bacteroidaceae bacterium]|nr:DUF5606 domain-containing protein [Bacteroidaceae bacterium]